LCRNIFCPKGGRCWASSYPSFFTPSSSTRLGSFANVDKGRFICTGWPAPRSVFPPKCVFRQKPRPPPSPSCESWFVIQGLGFRFTLFHIPPPPSLSDPFPLCFQMRQGVGPNMPEGQGLGRMRLHLQVRQLHQVIDQQVRV